MLHQLGFLDSGWEGEFCRVVEAHPRVLAYVKKHRLGLEVPYRMGSENHKYRPDFIVLIDDGHGKENPLHLVVEIKSYRKGPGVDRNDFDFAGLAAINGSSGQKGPGIDSAYHAVIPPIPR